MTEGTDLSLNISSTVLSPVPGSSSLNVTFLVFDIPSAPIRRGKVEVY